MINGSFGPYYIDMDGKELNWNKSASSASDNDEMEWTDTANHIIPNAIGVPNSDSGEEFVEMFTMDEFNAHLAELESHGSGVGESTFRASMEKMKSLFSERKLPDGNVFWELWLHFPQHVGGDRHIQIILCRENFCSNTFSKEAFEHLERRDFSEPTWHLKGYSGNEDQNPLMYASIDPIGEIAEVTWLSGNQEFSGNFSKRLCLRILDALKIGKYYLTDTASYPLATKLGPMEADDIRELDIRKYLPVISKDAQTWYSKEGFEIFSCHQMLASDNSTLISQSFYDYKMSVRKIRETTIYRLVNNHFTSSAHLKKMLFILTKDYIHKNITRSIRLEHNDSKLPTTVHDLGCAIFKAMKNYPEGSYAYKRTAHDFATFYDLLLMPQEGSDQEYYKAISTLYTHTVWVKYNK